MNTGIRCPLAGLVAYAPRNTPVLALFSWRSRSDFAAMVARYAATASAGVAAPNVQRVSTSAGHCSATNASTNSCSGASTMYVAPNKRVRPCREHLDIAGFGREQHRRPGGPADPVALHGLDLLRPIQQFQVVEQPVGVRGDAHHPLPQPLPEHREIPPVAAAVGGDLLVGQHGAESRAPVHQRFRPVHQAIRIDDVRSLTRRQIRPRPAIVESPATGLEFGDEFGDGPGFVGRPGRTMRCRSAGRSTGSTCRSRRRWSRSYGGHRGPARGAPAAAGS